MHIFTNTKPVETGSTFGTLAPGSWLVTDQNAAEFALLAERGSWSVMRFSEVDYNGGHDVLIIRSGAIGDLLLMSPATAAFRATFPTRGITLCCAKKHHSLFAGSDQFDELVEYPLQLYRIAEYTRITSLENVMELAPTVHATDAFAAALGVTVTDYKPTYGVTDDEKAAALLKHPRTQRRRLGIQMMPSGAGKNRAWRLEKWASVIQKMLNRNWEIYAFGTEKQMAKIAPAPCLTPVIAPFRESAAILSTCDAFCGIDSSLIHLCHALDIPAVGLYAAFRWETRTAKAPLTHVISGVAPCAPCSWHQKAGRHFPPGQECAKKGYCLPLDAIEADRVVAKLDAILKP